MGGRGCHCRWAKLGRVIVTSLLLDRIREKKEKVCLPVMARWRRYAGAVAGRDSVIVVVQG